MEIEIAKVAALHFDPENARKHNKKNLDAIKGSLQKFGQFKPIVVDTHNKVLAGNGTLAAAQELGWSEIKVVRYDVSHDDGLALALADNRTAELAEWEDSQLLATLEYLKGIDFDIASIGFEGFFDSLEPELNGDPDDVPDVKETGPTRVQKGELWQLGDHLVYCGDSTEIGTATFACQNNLVQLIVTDPPYNVDYVGKTKDALKIQNDKMDDDAFYQFLLDAFQGAFLIADPGAAMYVAHADTYGLQFRKAYVDAGFDMKQCLIWAKDSMVMGRQDYHWKHEPILYGWKPGAAHNWYTDRKQTTVLEFARPKRSEEHPTMKPVELFEYLVKNSSKPGDAVLDIFGGSGTTLVACEKTRRKARLVELDPRYCDVIVTRWEKLTGKEASRID